MKQPIFFPFYSIYSDIVKTSLGLKDNRSIEKFFKEAGIKVYDIGEKKCVLCEDLLAVTKPKPVIFRYTPQSELERQIYKKFK